MPENITCFFLLTPLPKDSLWWRLWVTSQTLSFFWGETHTQIYMYSHTLKIRGYTSSWSSSSHHNPQRGIPQDSGHVNALLNTFQPHILPISSIWESKDYFYSHTSSFALIHWYLEILRSHNTQRYTSQPSALPAKRGQTEK